MDQSTSLRLLYQKVPDAGDTDAYMEMCDSDREEVGIRGTRWENNENVSSARDNECKDLSTK